MPKRDPNKTARNRIINKIKLRLRELLPAVLVKTKLSDAQSLNATIGCKHNKFMDLKNDVIYSCDQFINIWLQGLTNNINRFYNSSTDQWLYDNFTRYPEFKEYLLLFLKRSYLKHFDELSKKRPRIEEAEIWIGQNRANYGLLVTPRFNGQWENDKSEIRSFKEGYWTIGHVLKTGLVIPGINKIFLFKDLDQYLIFFKETLVRNSGSPYEYELAGHYCDYVNNSCSPERIPLLIPEFRYLGIDKKHRYRLDFLIINPFTLDKVGFELSPWSSHGYLKNTKKLTQSQINEMAKNNFENEMRKHRDFFRKYNIYVLIYTDDLLSDTKKLFEEEVRPFLEVENPINPLSFKIMENFIES